MFGERLNNNQGWADLHEDMLLLIKGKLQVVDQLRFRAVCRDWRSLFDVRPADKLPWLVVHRPSWESCDARFTEFKRCDPSNNKEYLYGIRLTGSTEFNPITIFASKYGWVFMAAKFKTITKFFLYHAFTMKTIGLPAMAVIALYRSKGTFSTAPTCSDCLFCVMEFNVCEYRLYTCRTGDATWIKFNLEFPGSKYRVLLNDMIYRKGLIYYLFFEGLLWTFDIACNDYQQVLVDTSEITNAEPKLDPRCYGARMIESNEELLLLYANYMEEKPWYVYKLDWSLMAWVKQVTLGDRALFAGVTPILIPTGGNIKSLSDRIYFCADTKVNYYSLKNNAHHQSREYNPLMCKYFSSFRLFAECDRFVWVEPYL